MTIREALKRESKTINLMILHYTGDGRFYKYWLDPDCLIYTGQEEIEHIGDEILDLSVVTYDAIRMYEGGTLLTIWI